MINEPRAPDRARPYPAKARLAVTAAVRGTIRATLISSALVGTTMLGAILMGTAPSGAAPAGAGGQVQSEPAAQPEPCASTPPNDSGGLDPYRFDSYCLGDSDLPGRSRLGALRPYLVAGSTEPWPTPDPPMRTGLGMGTLPDAADLSPLPTSVPIAAATQPPAEPGLAGGGAAGSPRVAGREGAASSAGAQSAKQSARPDAARAVLPPTIGWTEAEKRSLIYSGALALALATVGLAMVGWRRRQW
jgi:hypothetical protein